MTDDEPGVPASLAGRMDRLFQVIHPRGRGPHTAEAVVAGVITGAKTALTASTPEQLRRGGRTAATTAELEAIAALFGLRSTAYVADDAEAEHVDATLELLRVLRDTDVRHRHLYPEPTAPLPATT